MNLQEWQEFNELLRVVTEAAKEFHSPEDYGVRKLRGGGYWIYLPHQAILRRVLEVAPDAIFGRAKEETLGVKGDVWCQCWLEIAGHRKWAIASVPLEVPNNQGEDVAIGAIAERLQAESVKNAAEMWGFGDHVDDQFGLLIYLEENAEQLSESTITGLKNVRAYLTTKQEAKCPAKHKRRFKRESDIVEDSTLVEYQKRQKQLRNTPKPTSKNQSAQAQLNQPVAQATIQTTQSTKPVSLYPQHDQIVKRLRDRLNIDPQRILELTQGRYPGQLDYERFRELLILLVSSWAEQKEYFSSAHVAATAIQGFLKISSKQLEPAISEWIEACIASNLETEPVF